MENLKEHQVQMNIIIKMLNVKYENNIEFILSDGNIHKISAIVDFDTYPNTPKIKFSRDENSPIQ